MDDLIGSKISLISHADVRYDGVLYSINQKDSFIVLKEGNYFTTNNLFIKFRNIIDEKI